MGIVFEFYCKPEKNAWFGSFWRTYSTWMANFLVHICILWSHPPWGSSADWLGKQIPESLLVFIFPKWGRHLQYVIQLTPRRKEMCLKLESFFAKWEANSVKVFLPQGIVRSPMGWSYSNSSGLAKQPLERWLIQVRYLYHILFLLLLSNINQYVAFYNIVGYRRRFSRIWSYLTCMIEVDIFPSIFYIV